MVRILHSGFYFDITWLAPFSCLIRLLVSCVFRCHLSPYFLAQNLPAGPANYICATFIAFPKHFFLFHHIRCIFHIAPRILFFTSWEPDCIIRIRDISGSFDPLTSCRPGYILLPGFLFSQLFWSNFSKQNWIDNLPCCRHKNRIFSVFFTFKSMHLYIFFVILMDRKSAQMVRTKIAAKCLFGCLCNWALCELFFFLQFQRMFSSNNFSCVRGQKS